MKIDGNILGSIIISVALIIGAILHAYITKVEWSVSTGNEGIPAAVINTKSGIVYLMDSRGDGLIIETIFKVGTEYRMMSGV